jgi:hypothetical protein
MLVLKQVHLMSISISQMEKNTIWVKVGGYLNARVWRGHLPIKKAQIMQIDMGGAIFAVCKPLQVVVLQNINKLFPR